MALDITPNVDSVANDCDSITVKDETGTYDASDNPGGYGAPNTARADLGLKLFVTLKHSTGDEAITIDPYNEETADEWTVTIEEDGVYEVYLAACPDHDNTNSYNLDDIVYSASEDEFYKAIQNVPTGIVITNTSYWEVADEISDFTAADNVSDGMDYEPVLCRADKCAAEANHNWMKASNCGCKEGTEEEIIYHNIRNTIEATLYNHKEQNYSKAQIQIEWIQEQCEDLDCKNC